MITDPDGKPGLRVETAASVIIHEFVLDHMSKFALTIRRDRLASTSVMGEYINAMAGTMALVIAGGHGSRDEVIALVQAKLLECLDRDLRHMA